MLSENVLQIPSSLYLFCNFYNKLRFQKNIFRKHPYLHLPYKPLTKLLAHGMWSASNERERVLSCLDKYVSIWDRKLSTWLIWWVLIIVSWPANAALRQGQDRRRSRARRGLPGYMAQPWTGSGDRFSKYWGFQSSHTALCPFWGSYAL